MDYEQVIALVQEQLDHDTSQPAVTAASPQENEDVLNYISLEINRLGGK